MESEHLLVFLLKELVKDASVQNWVIYGTG